MKHILTVFFLSMLTTPLFAQCDGVTQRVRPDGSLFYYLPSMRFYWTEVKQLHGEIITDKEDYYLGLEPSPFPEKSKGEKFNKKLSVKLSNGDSTQLEQFDARYVQNDSSLVLIYLIKKDQLDLFLNNDINQVKINMGKEEGIRTYNFKLHKSALREQLACFVNDKKKK